MYRLLQATRLHRAPGNSTRLIVIVHGVAGWRAMKHVLDATHEAASNADVLEVRYSQGLFLNADPITLTEELVEWIDHATEGRLSREGGDSAARAYDDLILVGHSVGALLVRKALLFANGFDDDGPRAPLRRRPAPWASLVSRVVLIAGLNRGWSLRPRPCNMSRRQWLLLAGLEKCCEYLPFARFFMKVRRGSPFVVNLRLQWHLFTTDPATRAPHTIQILGDVDDFVSHSDSIDLESGQHFCYVNAHDSGHKDVLNFEGSERGRHRRDLYIRAITAPPSALLSDFAPPVPRADPKIQDVVFIMHGIRDYGDWIYRCRRVFERHPRASSCRVNTSGYGYFPMGKFLLLPERERNVRWFMDEYAEARTRFPNARIHFVGHSNGTYLAARALAQYAVVTFESVVFAGSVVRRDFPWDSLVAAGRVGRVRNDMATSDWVVGIFPAAYEWVGGDIGGAGFTGFLDSEGQRFNAQGPNQGTLFPGGHGAALLDKNFETYARFVLDGDSGVVPLELKSRRPGLVTLLAKANLVVWGGALLIVFLALWVSWPGHVTQLPHTLVEWMGALGLRPWSIHGSAGMLAIVVFIMFLVLRFL